MAAIDARVLFGPGFFLTAKVSFELLVRGAEIMLGRATDLSVAMTGPEALVEIDLGDFGMRDFDRLDEARDAGRIAMDRALPNLALALDAASVAPTRLIDAGWTPCIDPVCAILVSPKHARASTTYGGTTLLFCSENCRDTFLRDPSHYKPAPPCLLSQPSRPYLRESGGRSRHSHPRIRRRLFVQAPLGASAVCSDGAEL